TLNIGNMRNATLLFIILLMFIGASPGGTGGGIKTVTFTVLISAVRATLMGYENVEIMERKLYWDSVRKAWALFFLSIGLIFIGWFTLLISENFLPINLLFEVVSAFGTVGLSTGITPSLSTVGRIVIILVMYLGRVGLVVFGLSFLYPLRRKSHIELPYGEVSIG
ncbi:MAG TPA: potassium transporter TrkG, partial [bacterium]|nr:potassium transporter TrkG [bacterium]